MLSRSNQLRLSFRTLRLALGMLVLFLGAQSAHAVETASGFKAQIEGAGGQADIK